MVYITTPAISTCSMAFFSDPYSAIKNFEFFIHLVCVLFIYPVMGLLLIMIIVVDM